jgi:chromosomal replication initiator protein
VPLPDNVAMHIAGKIKSNVRELEGSLIRLIAYASLTGQEITLPLAQDVLKSTLDHEKKAVTIGSIQTSVAQHYNLRLVELKSRNNSKEVAMPRQVAMYLCKALTHASLPEIGRSFGGKHHSTVIYSIRKVEALRKRDGHFKTLIDNFLEGLL